MGILMQAGKLDRLLTIQRPSLSQDAATGAVVTGYDFILQVWGERLPQPSAEQLSEGSVHHEPRTDYRIRYYAEIAAANMGARLRLVDAGATRDIVDVRELGRREGLLLSTVARGEAA